MAPLPQKTVDLRQVLHGIFKRAGREHAWILHTLRQQWPAIVGASLAEKCFPLRLKSHVLWVGAPNAAWAHELQFERNTLLSSIHAFLEESGSVTELRFQQATPPFSTHHP